MLLSAYKEVIHMSFNNLFALVVCCLSLGANLKLMAQGKPVTVAPTCQQQGNASNTAATICGSKFAVLSCKAVVGKWQANCAGAGCLKRNPVYTGGSACLWSNNRCVPNPNPPPAAAKLCETGDTSGDVPPESKELQDLDCKTWGNPRWTKDYFCEKETSEQICNGNSITAFCVCSCRSGCPKSVQWEPAVTERVPCVWDRIAADTNGKRCHQKRFTDGNWSTFGERCDRACDEGRASHCL